MDTELIKPIPYSIGQITKLRDKIVDAILLEFGGTTPVGEDFDAFVRTIDKYLPFSVSFDTLFESIRCLVGTNISKDSIFDTIWRICANIPRLRNGTAVPPWSVQTDFEWVPVHIIEFKHHKNKYGERGYLFAFKVMAGTPCPLTIIKFWSFRFCKFISRELGFTSQKGNFPFIDGRELVNLRMLALVDPDKSKDEPYFDKTKHTATTKAWNKKILLARAKIDPPCPYSFTHDCFRCPVGYVDCIAGVHPETYQVSFCPSCKQDAYFDPVVDSLDCVDCRSK